MGEKFKKRAQIPASVLVAVDMTSTPDKDADRFLTRDNLLTQVFTDPATIGRVGRHHKNRKECNALFQSGSVALIRPELLENWMIRIDDATKEPGRWESAKGRELPF